MKALMRKDFYVLRKTFLLYTVILAVIQLSPGLLFITILYAVFLPNTAFSYDDLSRWGEVEAVLPYSDWEIVLSRYAVGWICVVGLNLVAAATRFLVFTLSGGRLGDIRSFPNTPSGFLLVCAVCFICIALVFPIEFRFDTVKAKLVRLLMIMLIAGGIGGTSAYMIVEQNRTDTEAIFSTLSPWPVVLAAILLTSASLPLSRLAYRARRG